MLKGLINNQWLRVAEEIMNESRPTFLVSMTQHRNILVNSGACSLMGCTAEELLNRDLTPFWVPPGEVKPISYSVQLPPHLAEFHRLLGQQSELINHNFEGWKITGDNSDAIWVRWNDDIKFVELDGNPYRLMRVNGFDEVKV
jgi:PAS domain-containing protein